MLSLAVPGAKPFAPFPLGSVMARPLRDSLARAPRGRAGRLRRRSTRSRVNILTSRYPLAVDDRAARAGIDLDHWHVAAQPTAPSTRQSPGRHFRTVQRHLSPIVPYWRKLHGCRFRRPTETIHPGRHQGRPADESRFRAGNCAPASFGPRHGQRRLPGCCRQWLPATAGNMQGHNRDIGSRSSLSDRGRLPLRPRERGTYLTGVRPGMRAAR